MVAVTINGREIDNSCPWSGSCFADGGCSYQCPETYYNVLCRTAELEHECELLPHTDPDIKEVCRAPECNDGRKQRPPDFRPDISLIGRQLK